MTKKRIWIIALSFLLIFSLFMAKLNNQNTEVELSSTVEEIEKKEEKEEEIVPKIIKVEIKGQVKNPGVFEMSENDRVIDLIHKAGGLLKPANTNGINLSKHLTDEMLVIIYSDQEIKDYREKEMKKYEKVEIPCICPDTNNDACEKNEDKENKMININKATKEELMTIPNIGESKADNIIRYRENFTFTKIDDIKEVSGIGEALFEQIKAFITV